MPTTLDLLRDRFAHAIRGQFPDIYDADAALVPTTNPAFGDYQCNAPMALAKRLKQKPRDVAAALVSAIGDLGGMAEKVEIAGPGFINVTLAAAFVEQNLGVAAADGRLGIGFASTPQRVVVDYPSINMAKESHIGHLRPSAIGDACARILAFAGHTVLRQNHVGDWGTAFGMLLAYAKSEPEGMAAADLDALYKAAKQRFDDDPAFADAARAAVVRLQAGEPAELARWQGILAVSRRHMREIFDVLGLQIRDDEERGESFYNPMLKDTVEALRAIDVAVESDGAVGVFVDGPDKPPLIIQKSGGGYLYGTTDLAAVRYRVNELKADRILYYADARQAQHFSQVFRTVALAGWVKGVELKHVGFGTILGRDGKPLKTRSGDAVRLKDILDEAVGRATAVVVQKEANLDDATRVAVAHAVGIGAVKYADLNKDWSSDYVFDFDTMLAMDGNTAPYLQYAHARIRSIFRKAAVEPTAAPVLLAAPEERALGLHLIRFGEMLDVVVRDLKPHVLCQYLYDTATKFSGFYEKCPVLKSDEPTRSSRLTLCDLTARTLALGLDLLGIEHPEQL